jgi:hypothetical protein
MKKIYLSFIGAVACMMSSCSGMLDSIQPYLDEGEIIYAGKMGSIYPFVGKNRVRLLGFTVYGVNQTKCTITWKNPVSLTTTTRELDLDPAKHQNKLSTDSLYVLLDTMLLTGRWDELEKYAYVFELDSLEEGLHDFSVVLFDPQGNRSIPTLASAYVRGEQYEASLLNREIRQITAVQVDAGNGKVDAAHIRWMLTGSTEILGCNLTYDLQGGGTQDIFVAVRDTVADLLNYRPGGKCSYTTLYRPEGVLSLDTFYAPKQTITLPGGSEF